MTAPLVMTFANIDAAESALDWIGLDFGEADGRFEGDLFPEDSELLDDAIDDPDSPEPVRALAAALRDLLAGSPDGVSWVVTFGD